MIRITNNLIDVAMTFEPDGGSDVSIRDRETIQKFAEIIAARFMYPVASIRQIAVSIDWFKAAKLQSVLCISVDAKVTERGRHLSTIGYQLYLQYV